MTTATKKQGEPFVCVAHFAGGCWAGESRRFAWPPPPLVVLADPAGGWCRYRLIGSTAGKGKRTHTARYEVQR